MASTSNPKQGRKQRVLTLEKKLDIIKELKGGKSQRCVSELHQVPKSTVSKCLEGKRENRKLHWLW